MILLLGGIKGGTGKSTLATNLAVLRSSKGYKTLLIDADDQCSSTDWFKQRKEYFKDKKEKHVLEVATIQGKNLYAHVEKFKSKYKDIIIDAGGRDTASQRSALSIADTYLIPFRPRSFDVWTLQQVRKLYEEVKEINPKLKACVVINQADPRGIDNTTAYDILTEIPQFKGMMVFITYRKSFANASADGLAVTERGTDQKAREEIWNLYHAIYD